MKSFCLTFLFLISSLALRADAYLSMSAPASAFSGIEYSVGVSATFWQDGYNDTFNLSLYKEGTYLASASVPGNAYSVSAGGLSTDYGTQTVNFYAYGWDLYNNVSDWISVPITDANGVQLIGWNFDNSTPLSLGAPRTLTVIAKNIGGTTWSTDSTPHRLGLFNPIDSMIWGVNRLGLAAGETIAPGAQKTFSAALVPSQPGIQIFQWRMVEDGVEWFGDTTAQYVINVLNVVPTNELSLPASIFVGQAFGLFHVAANPTALPNYLTGFRIHERREDIAGNVYQDWTELNRVDPAAGNRSYSTTRPASGRPGTIRYHARSWNQWMGEWDNLIERVVTVPNRDPSVSVQILDAGQNVIGLQGNGNARIPIGSQFYIRVNGSDPDGRLARLYSRLNDPSGNGLSYPQQDVSGGSAYAVFGPYTANALGSYNVWAHAEDADQTGYQWQGGGWAGTENPDIEVYQPNRAPTVSLTINGTTAASGSTNAITVTNGAVLNLSSTASDLDNNFQSTRVWANFSGQGWMEIRNAASMADSFQYPLSGVGSWQFYARSRDGDGAESPMAIINVTSLNRSPTATLSADRPVALVGENVGLTLTVGDPDGNYDFANLWIKTPNTDWRWIRQNNALLAGGALDRAQTVTAYGANGTHTRTFTVVLNDGFGDYRFSLAAVDSYGARTDAPQAIITVSNRTPTVSLGSLPATLMIGQSLTLTSTAGDADGNLQGHGFWVRGPRLVDSFGADGNGWSEGPRTGHGLPAGWSSVSNSPNYSTVVNGSANTTSAMYAPTAPGYWQLYANSWDPLSSGARAISASMFVAPAPTVTLQATSAGVTVSGGQTLSIGVNQVVQLASTAAVAGWLSEHNIFGYENGNFFSPPNGGIHLPAQSGNNSSTRTVTWSPSATGTFVLYAEAFTGRSPGERVNGISGATGSFNDATPETERLTIIVYGSGDADGDGMDNLWETANALNPNNAADATVDTDGDGLINLQEYRLGTNPRASQVDSSNSTQLKILKP